MKNIAWEKLFKKYYNEALLYVFSFCHNRTLAEDIVQEAYMRAIRSIDEEKDGFKFWLFKVCRNLYFDMLRKNKRIEAIEGDVQSDDSLVDDVIQPLLEVMFGIAVASVKGMLLAEAVDHVADLHIRMKLDVLRRNDGSPVCEHSDENIRINL